MEYMTKTKIRVRYSETDMMGVVHHSRYYPWFEVARSDFIHESGISYAEIEKKGIVFPLIETGAKYHYGIKYDDELIVTCKIVSLSVAKCEFRYEVYKLPEMQLMTDGKTVHGFINNNFEAINLKKIHPEIWNSLNDMLTKENIKKW